MLNLVGKRVANWAILGLLMTLAIPVSAARETEVKKPAAPPDAKALAAVNTAAAALLKEAQAGFAPGGKLREKSDFFGEVVPPEITPDAILTVIEKSQNSDARIDAYIKWQLLSAVSGQFPPELASRALAAYSKAPEPINAPGLDRRKLNSLLYRVGSMKKDKMDDVNKEFGTSLSKNGSDNSTILNYRKAMYQRLPVSSDTLMAGLEDMFVRVRHGVAVGDLWDTVAGSIQSWSLTAEPRQRESIVSALNKLLGTAKDDRYKPYMRVTWNDDPKNAGMHWQDQMSVDEAKVTALVGSIRDAARMMDGVGFKDGKK
jgi:hypothetical protein